MRSDKGPLRSVWKAFDEVKFGPENTLNLRESLPTAADARYRTEAWLRERQISRAAEVLVITGRGNNSPDGISVVREAVLLLLPLLRRRGVVSAWKEHSPGSFVVKPGSISSLLEAPRRRRDRVLTSFAAPPKSLEGLQVSTLELLRRLATRSLESLGVKDPRKFIEAEMESKFNSLAGGIQPGVEGEARLREALVTALDQLDD